MGEPSSPPKLPNGAVSSQPSAAAQGSAVRGASLLIVLQILSRAVTFIANQLLLRFLTAQLLGVTTQLEVYYLSVLFFARESLRVAIQRQGSAPAATKKSDDGKDGAGSENAQDSQAVVNVGHLAVVLGLGAAIGLGGAYLHYVDAATASTPYLDSALYIYGVASIVELLSEPAFVVLQHRLRFGPRAAAESIGTFLRCFVTFGSVAFAWKMRLELGVLPFALGQLGYGFGLLGVYLWYGSSLASSEGFSLLPRGVTSATNNEKRITSKKGYTLGLFYKPTLHLASSMSAQSLVKHVLTQGDTFLVSILSSPQSQGVYALANNYGSLLARLVFQPIEESSRNYFSKLLSTSNSTPASFTDNKNPALQPEKQAITRAKNDLQSLLKFYTLLSTLIITIGPFALPLLVQLIAGSRWASSGAGVVLSQYCLYIPLLAINGVTEAFVSSVASESQVNRQSLWMGAFSFAFGIAGYICLRVLDMGAVGLVYANAINMLSRIVWSGTFISGWFDAKGVGFTWGDVVPKGLAIYVVGTAALWQGLIMAGVGVGSVSSHVFRDLVTVGVLALPYVGLVAYVERNYLLECYRSIRGGRASSP
ncbi:Rft protein-domain-containing protein [Pseudomassariella vexata]|uniref:Man(5)GlcNAc(2)-PP-dolichol translocation protein RFT1 n=1 Tax=Pseudomassariella vexata TaxID=1141098 RepID=A0A1Y2DAR9_9PEZI|nr:Rft protein-domain-containing protein [Pseudomassariella vexata]ORY56362.1 Rft protein-domain-containing protein [Pseudomassariella vexata]